MGFPGEVLLLPGAAIVLDIVLKERTRIPFGAMLAGVDLVCLYFFYLHYASFLFLANLVDLIGSNIR